MREELRTFFDARHERALNKFDARFDPIAWGIAVDGKSETYQKALKDTALLICGSPYRIANHRAWTDAAMGFLRRFM
ncbi:MAG: hypothetical protein GY832_26190 [Chloroflexi bacterium]|nr:hypothetical protein [Chloroflexota bacterium]